MKAGPQVIGQLLQNRYRFCVPIYQRHYVWTRQKQIEPFWNDIRTKAIEKLAGKSTRFSHFMGAVVLEARSGFTTRRVPVFQIIDGQQRMTTFQIFLSAARCVAEQIKYEHAVDEIKVYQINPNTHLMEEPEVEKFKVWPTKFDRELFEDIVTKPRNQIRQKYRGYFYATKDEVYNYTTVPNILSAYDFFYQKILNSISTDDLENEIDVSQEGEVQLSSESNLSEKILKIRFDSILQAFVEEFKVVEITLEDGDDAQVIFETLNERGEPLLAADLIRNNLFQRADPLSENIERLFSEHWSFFEKPFWNIEEKQGRYKKPRIEFFFANYIAAKTGNDINLSKLFSEFKAFNKVAKFESVTDELIDLAKFGETYSELVSRDASTYLSTFSKKLLPWEVTTVYPLVFRIWNSNEMDLHEKVECLNALISFVVRRSVCGLTSKNYNKFFLSLVSNLDKNGWSKVGFLRLLLQQKSDTSRFPHDDEFAQKWIYSPIYKLLPSNRVRAILEEIEIKKRTKFQETDDLTKALTIEHIMPNEWLESWPMEDGTVPTYEQYWNAKYSFVPDTDSELGRISKRIRLVDTFGNLTLLTQPLNSKISNGPFNTKAKEIREKSLLAMNKEIVDSEIWSEDNIINRSEHLSRIAIEIWPTPNIRSD